ncbi:hypothetical protein GJV85_04100 [Sulfurimonas aquatica]|uniref:Porin family protein n=1 Tax=Sulfurimonas aquatica TaxID=2672570 RepID=A0A975AZE9_9BACT|nr:hypothetical protein [Sulfurimonas aquatica]QSZ41320.1 hypothetical protein GJV85_04100 [Sulfurimonas aquatica]
MLKVVSTIAFLAVSAFAIHTGELNINDTDLEVGVKLDVGQFNDATEPNTMFIGAKYLGADKGHSDNTNTELDPMFEGNFLVMREIGDKGLSLGMGAKYKYTKDFSALPLGLELGYKIPATDLVPMSINGALYYAPKVLCFENGKDFTSYRIYYDVEPIENAIITLGYRSLNLTQNTGGSFNYNSSWYFGFKVNF